MSLPNLPEVKKKGRYGRWKERREFGEAIDVKDVLKIVELNHILRKDGEKLGIPQISIEIIPKKYRMMASASEQGYRIKGDGMLTMPSSLSFDYRVVDELSLEELRSLAWHELGHYIFAYYFPDIDNKYQKSYEHYLVTETFADEFAFRKFGSTYIRATKKLLKFGPKKDIEVAKERLRDLENMAKYRKKTNKPYWMAFAKELGIKVKPNPKERMIVGIRPKKVVLKGLYEGK
jgi:hypothetical protein